MTGAKPLTRVVVGVTVPLAGALGRLIDSERDLVCAMIVDDASDFERAIAKHRPDLILLDLSWGDAATRAVSWVMETFPTPIIALDAIARTPSTRARAAQALGLGAVTVLDAPDAQTLGSDGGQSLLRELRAAARVPVVRRRTGLRSQKQDKSSDPPRASEVRGLDEKRRSHPLATGSDLALNPRGVSLIAVGASTGGPPCIRTVLSSLHAKSPPTLVVQHMPPEFMSGFVSWLDPLVPVPVLEAESQQILKAGHVYVAPGGRHLALGPKHVLFVHDGPAVSYQRPSVDVLFDSIAENAEGVAAGVLLTGMGEDGAAGLLAMRRRGHVTVAQDEASSTIFGMPGSAIALGAAQHVAAPQAIAEALGRLSCLLPPSPSKVMTHD